MKEEKELKQFPFTPNHLHRLRSPGGGRRLLFAPGQPLKRTMREGEKITSLGSN